MSHFEVRAKDGMARLGVFTTPHGTVKTPLLMPVVHPGKSLIKPQEFVDTFGFQMVIANSYIIKSHDHFREKAIDEGVHRLLGFDGPVMTDSGTFQMYVHGLAKGEIDPVEIIEFQKSIGSDIGTILDVFSDPKVGKTKVEEDVAISLERARVATPVKGDMMLAGTVQGGIYEDLRENSARELAQMDFDVHPIGGMVPLMEQYRYSDMVKAVLASKKHLPPNRPVHLFGCGHPMLFAQAALLGCDFFDSASYAKFAESGRMLFTTGTMHLDKLEELPCECPECSKTTARELLKLDKQEQDLSLMKHNLYVTAAELRRVRQAIRDGKLFELASVRAAGHPKLVEAFSAMMMKREQLIQADPVGKASSIMYAGPETLLRPEIETFHERVISRYPYRKTNALLLAPHLGDRPFADTLPLAVDEIRKRESEQLLLFFITPFGAVPWELEHVYPAQQCVFPEIFGPRELDIAGKRVMEIIEQLDFKKGLWLTRDTASNRLGNSIVKNFKLKSVKSLEFLDKIPTGESEDIWRMRKLRAILAYQWNIELSKLRELKEWNLEISKYTGKIRYVKKEDVILFTLVPTTGLLTPTYEGGQALLDLGLEKRYHVVIDSNVGKFVAKGKSALAKFVIGADRTLRPGEEVVVTDEDDILLGVGKALLSGSEMLSFSRGVAVSIRHSSQ
ncbi:MAG: tRNA guanosine(15) transglycosylase TgtA [Candidatus Thorarchaeota archaeon]